MFIGRSAELAAMQKRYESKRFECLIVYGLRRVGKTSLIREFCKDKPAVFFSPLQTSAQENIRILCEACAPICKERSGLQFAAANFRQAFESIGALAKKQRLVLVIDEYPYAAKSYPAMASLLQTMIDGLWKDTALYVILCGSSMSFMENEVLGHQSPLFGRRTGTLKLEPFEFFDSLSFMPGLPHEEQAELYGITGGGPQYLALYREGQSLGDYLKENLLSPDSFLFNEPQALIRQELREPAAYTAIVQAIAAGASRSNEIATKAHLDPRACSVYLKNLAELGTITAQRPFADDSSRKTVYSLTGGIFRFWYRFMPHLSGLIMTGFTARALEIIMAGLSDYMGAAFEQICLQWLWRTNKNGRLPFAFDEAGRWWGTDPRLKQQSEIDIVARSLEGRMLFCECKWRNESTGSDVLQKLAERSAVFSAPKSRHYALFSKRGFTRECRRQAEENGAMLITLEDMLKTI